MKKKLLLETTNKFWGPFVQGDHLSWGPYVLGDQMGLFGDCLFLGTNCGEPNVQGLNKFGTK